MVFITYSSDSSNSVATLEELLKSKGFEKIYKTYGDDVTIMMVNMTDGYQETYEKAEAHIKENNYTFPVYYDIDYSAATAYRVTSLPATYFIDAEGNLVTHAKGMIDYETLKKGIGMIVPK